MNSNESQLDVFTHLRYLESSAQYHRTRAREFLHLFNQDLKGAAISVVKSDGYSENLVMYRDTEVEAAKAALQVLCEFHSCKALTLEAEFSEMTKDNPGLAVAYLEHKELLQDAV